MNKSCAVIRGRAPRLGLPWLLRVRSLRVWLLGFTLCAGALVVAAPAADATTIMAQSLDEMSVAADMVIRAVVRETACEWNGDAIVTRVQLEVLDVWAGDGEVGQIITLYSPGGRIGNTATRIAGTADYPIGGELVVFAEGDNTEQMLSMSLAFSVFHIQRDNGQAATPNSPEQSGFGGTLVTPPNLQNTSGITIPPAIAVRNIGGLALLAPSNGQLLPVATPYDTHFDLDELEARVRTAIQDAGAGSVGGGNE